jgi:hypothetical protein
VRLLQQLSVHRGNVPAIIVVDTLLDYGIANRSLEKGKYILDNQGKPLSIHSASINELLLLNPTEPDQIALRWERDISHTAQVVIQRISLCQPRERIKIGFCGRSRHKQSKNSDEK